MHEKSDRKITGILGETVETADIYHNRMCYILQGWKCNKNPAACIIYRCPEGQEP